MLNEVFSVVGTWCLDHRKVKTVIGKARQGLSIVFSATLSFIQPNQSLQFALRMLFPGPPLAFEIGLIGVPLPLGLTRSDQFLERRLSVMMHKYIFGTYHTQNRYLHASVVVITFEHADAERLIEKTDFLEYFTQNMASIGISNVRPRWRETW